MSLQSALPMVLRSPDGIRKRGRQKNSSTHNGWGFFKNLPDDLLIEILARVCQPRSAIRCSAVCKKWYELTSYHSVYTWRTRFIHRSHLPAGGDHDKDDYEGAPVSFFLQYCYYDLEKSQSLRSHQHIKLEEDRDPEKKKNIPAGTDRHRFDLSFLPHGAEEIICVEASWADLILCSCYVPSLCIVVNYFICNPQSRQWIALPLPPPSSGSNWNKKVDLGFICNTVSCSESGPSIDSGPFSKENAEAQYKYRVVRFSKKGFYPWAYSYLQVDIFSSEDCQWRQQIVRLPKTLKRKPAEAPIIAYKGKLHRLTSEGVIVVDPFGADIICRVIELPIIEPGVAIDVRPYAVPGKPPFDVQCLGICRGLLRITYVGVYMEDPLLFVWDLEDYDRGEWCLAYKTRLVELVTACGGGFDSEFSAALGRGTQVIGFHPERSELVFIWWAYICSSHVLGFNLQTRKLIGSDRCFHRDDDSWVTGLTSRSSFQLSSTVPNSPTITDLISC